MKKIFLKLIAFMMIVLVLIGGTGIYIISFCCNDCQAAGIEAFFNKSCCLIHHHQHEDNKECLSTDAFYDHHNIHVSEDGCSIQRVSFDWFINSSSENQPNFSPTTFVILADVPINFAQAPFINNSKSIQTFSGGPPITCPRDYLSTLTILLI